MTEKCLERGPGGQNSHDSAPSGPLFRFAVFGRGDALFVHSFGVLCFRLQRVGALLLVLVSWVLEDGVYVSIELLHTARWE